MSGQGEAAGNTPVPDWASALDREWLVTDGLGGYASGTICGPNTRRYHGLLVAPSRPPLGRKVLLAKLEETLDVGGAQVALSANEFHDGTLHPRGYRYLADFRLEDGLPVWRYAIPLPGDAGSASAAQHSAPDGTVELEKRVWMEPGRPTTYIRYTLGGAQAARLSLIPLCTYRDFHRETSGSEDWRFGIECHGQGLTVRAFAGAAPYHLRLTPPPGRGWTFGGRPGWWWRFLHRAERERGLEALEDLYAAGTLECDLAPGESLLVTAMAEAGQGAGPGASPTAPLALDPEPPGPGDEDPFPAQLRRAAGQFLVARAVPGGPAGGAGPGAPEGRTVIAGYHWFGDWGRDTMVALPGLALATGRFAVAEAVLRSFARYVDKGLLPNRFPEGGAPLEESDYNTVDATLWYFHAVDVVDRYGGGRLVEGLIPVLAEILDWHIWGTRHGIRVDPQDGLLRTDNGQLTWMDARIGEWVVTARAGKPVEVAALWHHALVLMEGWCRRTGREPQARYYGEMRRRAAAGFARFWYAPGGHLYDALDGPQGDDASLRPNQVIAAGLADSPLTPAQRRAVVEVAVARLWTPRGLRTLAREDPRYRGLYVGDPRHRDGAYHQGSAWPWLLGWLVDAHLLVYGDRAAARGLVEPLRGHLFAEAGVGSISELFDGDPPHASRGCIAQAWSVAEVFRAWAATAPGPPP